MGHFFTLNLNFKIHSDQKNKTQNILIQNMISVSASIYPLAHPTRRTPEDCMPNKLTLGSFDKKGSYRTQQQADWTQTRMFVRIIHVWGPNHVGTDGVCDPVHPPRSM